MTLDTLVETLLTSYHLAKLTKLFPKALVDDAINRLRKLEKAQSNLESTWELEDKSEDVISDYFWAYIKSYATNSEIAGYTGSLFSSLCVLDSDKSGIRLLEGEFTYSKSRFWLVIGSPQQLSIKNHNHITSDKCIAAINANGYRDNQIVGNYVMNGKQIDGAEQQGCLYVGLKPDNKLYISHSNINYQNAAMFKPAIILDGKIMIHVKNGWGIHPRTIIAQRYDKSILLFVTEHRNIHNIGVNLFECAELLHQFGAVQALNLDGGSSSTLLYKGDLITGSGFSNIPNAFALSSTQ